MTIKSFRGLIAKGNSDTIILHTNNGSTGYKITKFELIAEKPFNALQEATVKIYSIDNDEVTTPTRTIDFSDNTLLAAGILANETANNPRMPPQSIIFGNTTFNQDIYVTYEDEHAGESINYYIELEQVKLSIDENTVATLKDIRNIASQ